MMMMPLSSVAALCQSCVGAARKMIGGVILLAGSLAEHLSKHSVEYIQFAFRWMNNLLMREFPLRCVIRLWDSYLSERDGFATFHVYVCAALLKWFSDEIQAQRDFQVCS